MSTQVDYSLGLGVESSYGTAVTVGRFFESEVKWKYKPVKVQGKGMQPTKAVNRLKRNTLARIEASGDQEVEVLTKGFGVLLQAVFGGLTNTLVAAGATGYQQVHTLATTDPVRSHTVQGVLPTLGGGAGNPHTFTGCVADSITFDVKEGGILTAKIAWLAKTMSTSISAAAASYPVADLFSYVNGAIYKDVTSVPTTTSLAVGTTALANVTEFSLTVKNNLDKAGYNLGGGGVRVRENLLGVRSITGKMKIEYSDNLLRDAYIAQTPLGLVLTFTQVASGALGYDLTPDPIYPTVQIVLPSLLLGGNIPESNGGAPIVIDIDFEAFDNGTAAQPIWVVYRTADTAP
ncbi:phage tail tube protein [Cryobacterium sp. RTC2.1]|uniref:phage tail tube protein n=1 Tax=Cryobacterium sp. RTC2.1 TaxID=3048634 RepID=UPI002B23C9D3|nr:phage tail tube protein [Cryobacterium sp. RTC2.1]MEB0001602.1 phage tail tube protein [Cryobacterium sp. RTC2.1]